MDDPAIDRNIPEVFTADHGADPSAADPAYLEELRHAGAPVDLFYLGYDDPALMEAADVALARVAAWEIRTRRPRFLAIHLSATDAIQHDHGPDHYLSHAAITSADRCVGILREAVREAGLAEATTFVVTADHGFHTVRYEVNVRPLLDALGLTEVVALHPDGWTLFVETLEGFNPERHGAVLETFLERALSLPGIARVVRPEGFHALGFPRYEEDPHVPGQYMIFGDVDTFPVDDPDDPRATVRPKRPPYSGHGYLPGHPRMYPALVLAGRGVKRGARVGHVRHLDVAATLAHLLGVELPDLPGRVIGEALLSPATPLTRGSSPPDR
jgi:arylsulfatase A-like enzyme